MRALFITAALVLILGLVAPLQAGWKEGYAAWKRGNYAAALREFKSLAVQGDARAQTFLGYMYHDGHGVPKNYTRAVYWYQKASRQGRAQAQFNLASMYFYGKGVPIDNSKAAYWFQRAAKQGYINAQLILGHLYRLGRGVPQNYVKAYMWFNISAAQGNTKVNELGVKFRNYLAKRMTPAQIAKAQRLADEFRPKKERR